MTTGGPATGRDGRSAAPRRAALAQRTDLPPRVRALLDALWELARAYFESALPRTLDEIENALFSLAERARSNTQQQRHFEALREIKRGRASFAPRFLEHVDATLAQVRARPGPAAASAAPMKSGALELVETAAFEEDLAAQDASGRAEIRHSVALYLLSHRIAVLAATPAWPLGTLPLAPAPLVAAFRHALDDLELEPDARVLAYRHFDRMALTALALLYDSVNAYLVRQRVLPNLQILSQWRGDAARPDEARPPLPAPAPADPAPTAAAPAVPPAAVPPALDGPATDEPGHAAATFTTLRQLLAERRRREGGEAVPSRELVRASGSELQEVLGALQRRAPGPASARLDGEHLKNTLLVRLRRAGAPGRPLGLRDEDADTVDLVGLLFDHIAEDLRGSTNIHGLLARLHVPVLRVALHDKSFFTRRDHPARELLNTIAETATRWSDGDDADPELVRKMQSAVEQVNADFDGDLGVFENLLGELGGHMQTLARRADAVERRHVDAARGRDRLDHARATAEAAIERVLRGAVASPSARALLEQAWTDALALSVLRHGADSAEFSRRVAVAARLARRRPGSADDELRQELDAGLRQVGLHEADVNAALDSLFAGAAPAQAHGRLDAALSGRPRLGGDAAPAAPVAPALDAAEAAQLRQLRQMPFGTWFEFALSPPEGWVRRKLAWYSTVSGRCLFVTPRGARAEDRTLEQLARDMVQHRARVAAVESTSLIDRAWRAIGALLMPPSDSPAVTGGRA